jgi:phosphoribosylanthranilate isomerase
VKICGITRPEDAGAAASCGADAIGLVFYPASPRALSIEQARAICRATPPFVTRVALFVDPDPALVRSTLGAVAVDLLQFHGSEPADLCGGFGRPYIKAFGVREGYDICAAMAAHEAAAGFLFDAWQPAIHGGGGVTFDWKQVPAAADKPAILAGGLNPGNVEAAVRQVRPYAVDVSSGVEVDKGIKSAEKIAEFIRGVAGGDAE